MLVVRCLSHLYLFSVCWLHRGRHVLPRKGKSDRINLQGIESVLAIRLNFCYNLQLFAQNITKIFRRNTMDSQPLGPALQVQNGCHAHHYIDGKSGVDETIVTAATGLRLANLGYKTIVILLDRAHSLFNLFKKTSTDAWYTEEIGKILCHAHTISIFRTSQICWTNCRGWLAQTEPIFGLPRPN